MARKLVVYVASIREEQLLEKHALLETKDDVIPLRPVVICHVDNAQAVEEGKAKLLEGIDKIVAATREKPVEVRAEVSQQGRKNDGNKKYGIPDNTKDPKILRAREREAQGE